MRLNGYRFVKCGRHGLWIHTVAGGRLGKARSRREDLRTNDPNRPKRSDGSLWTVRPLWMRCNNWLDDRRGREGAGHAVTERMAASPQ